MNLVINRFQCRIIVNNVKQKPSDSIKDRTSSIDYSTANFSKKTLPHKVNTVVFKPRLLVKVPGYYYQHVVFVYVFMYSSVKTWGGVYI